MRALPVFLLLGALAGCKPSSEAVLPKAGTLYEKRDSGDRFKVTRSGKTSYNLGGCPVVGSLCVHLVCNVDDPMAAELALTMSELNGKFRQVRR